MEVENNNTPTPEELQVEQEALAEVKDDDIRKSVVTSLGLEDNDANKDLITKFVEREKGNRKKLSEAIGQKIKYREKAAGIKPQETNKSAETLDAEGIRKQTEETVKAQFDEEYLAESPHSDELKAEMRRVAKLNGTTVRAITKDPYIAQKIEAETKARQAAEAAANGGGNGRPANEGGSEMPSQFNDPAYMITPAGQKAYADWEAARKK